MCYLKNLAIDEQVDFDDLFAKADESSADSSEHELNVVIPCCEKQLRAEWSEEQQMLINLFDLIDRNNHIISSLSKVPSDLFRPWTSLLRKLGKVLSKSNQPLKKNPCLTAAAPNPWRNPAYPPTTLKLLIRSCLDKKITNIRSKFLPSFHRSSTRRGTSISQFSSRTWPAPPFAIVHLQFTQTIWSASALPFALAMENGSTKTEQASPS